MSARSLGPFCQAGDRRLSSTLRLSASRFAKSESYVTLVWRKLRRSVTGMIGLILVGTAAVHGDLR